MILTTGVTVIVPQQPAAHRVITHLTGSQQVSFDMDDNGNLIMSVPPGQGAPAFTITNFGDLEASQ